MRESRKPDGSRAPFDLVTIFLHWLTAILVGFQLLTGSAMAFWPTLMSPLLLVHRSSGVLVFVVTALRLLWRQSFARFPPFPERMPRVLQWLARRSEHGLYVLLLLQPVTGLAMSAFRGRPFQIFTVHVPVLVSRNLDTWPLLQNAHRVGAYALAGLAAGHAFMALIHHYILRDDVLAMMAPWLQRHSDEKRDPAMVATAARETA
jgi:cytochrome b561